MDTKRLALALVVALVITGGATYAFYRLRGPGGPTVPMRKVVVSSKELAAGSVLKAEDLTTADWPVNLASTGVFGKVDEVVGRAVVYPVGEKDIIRERDLAAPGSGLGLAPKIPPGMRAVSVRSNEVVGVAGFLYPGSRVDVLATLRPTGGSSNITEPITQTVLQDVEVITAGQRIQPDPEGKPQTVNVVTLLLNPEDSQKLMLASSQADIQFVLRSGADKEKVETEAVSVADLLGKSKKVPPPPPPRRPGRRISPTEVKTPKVPNFYTVEVIQGEQRSEEKFE
ncbi:MAG: Flp pilus assembly protein CpaB [Acidobacteria bacterium]|nr:Flp pilus assembly protein CpaB [Acidobacteriota bacterium]